MQEIQMRKEEEIIVFSPYSFEPMTNILRRGGKIVKNWWSTTPTQNEVSKVTKAIDDAVELIKK